MNRRRYGTTLVAIVALAACAVIAAPAAGQEVVQIDGRVSWVSGQTMLVTPTGGLPVTVDLTEVDLDQYRALLPGERIVVTGRLTPERNRVIATAIQRGAP